MSVNIQMRNRGCNLAKSWVYLQDRSSFGFRTEELKRRFSTFTFTLCYCLLPLHKRRFFLKAQHERADNCALKEENDRIRCENIAIREAIKHAICLNCGDAPLHEDSYFDEQKLRIENAHLREEVLAFSFSFLNLLHALLFDFRA